MLCRRLASCAFVRRICRPTDANAVAADVDRVASMRPFGISLKTLFDYGHGGQPSSMLKAAIFLHKELPIRLARCVKLLEKLPDDLPSRPALQRVASWYIQSFADIHYTPPPCDSATEAEFTRILQRILDRHANVLPAVASAIQQVKTERGGILGTDLQHFLDKFYTARIGLRMLIGQHIALHSPVRGFVGLIAEACSPAEIAEDAAEAARAICMRTIGEAPRVDVISYPKHLAIQYVPSHIYQMMFELVKNSCRANVEHHSGTISTIPRIRITIAGGGEDVSIRISDEGGGIRRSGLPHLFSYFYTTADAADNYDDPDTAAPRLAGYGFGLPISRLYARYFGGDMHVMSLEGYGST